MLLKKSVRRALVLALLFSFTISGFTTEASAQRRRRRSQPQAAAPPRKQMPGTEHKPPTRTYDVEHYTIRTRFDTPNKTVYGDVTVRLRPLSTGFRSFELDAAEMEFESVTLEPTGERLRWSHAGEKLSITLERAYTPSDEIAVRIKYSATPEKGLYFTPGTPASRFRRWAKPSQIWSQGEPEDNHHWFPCYDFPDDKATSEQFITTSANEIALSNGALLETTDNADRTRTFHWKMDQPHSTYLISLVVGDYVKLTDSYKNIPVEYYTYRGTETKARNSFAKTPEMMSWYSQRLDYEFPYNKYAQIIVSNFIFGGMENITATTQADTEILSGEGDDPSLSVNNLVSHELSHSWFGNLATAKDWANLWVNEGFATFFEAAYKEHAEGRDAYLNELRADAATYFSEDTYQYRRPIISYRYQVPVDTFDSTLYKKGGFVVHMLRETVGDEVFWKALNVYLNEFKYRNAGARDMQAVFERVSGKRLDWFFDQWLFKAGYPELRVRQTYNPSTRTLTLDVAQTQTPDALTPAVFQLPNVEVEITTPRGKSTERIDITERTKRFTFQLYGPPQLVRFDSGERVLKRLDFPQSRAALLFQLSNGTDAVARIEAAEALEQAASERLTAEELKENVRALAQSLAKDSFYGVRAASASALANYRSDEATTALINGMRDKDERVRSVALDGLQGRDASESAQGGWIQMLFTMLRERNDLSRSVL